MQFVQIYPAQADFFILVVGVGCSVNQTGWFCKSVTGPSSSSCPPPLHLKQERQVQFA